MKTKNNIMGTIVMGAFACAISIGMTSCNNNETKTDDTKAVAEDHNDAKFDNEKAKDADFMVKAAEINLEEIHLGELAKAQSTSSDIKDLATMMVTAHTKALTELEALAAKKGITVPTSITADGQDAYDKLMKESGTSFDKKYADMMVDGHKNAIAKFEKASTDADDTEIKAWAAKMLPDLRMHLDHSMNIQQKYK